MNEQIQLSYHAEHWLKDRNVDKHFFNKTTSFVTLSNKEFTEEFIEEQRKRFPAYTTQQITGWMLTNVYVLSLNSFSICLLFQTFPKTAHRWELSHSPFLLLIKYKKVLFVISRVKKKNHSSYNHDVIWKMRRATPTCHLRALGALPFCRGMCELLRSPATSMYPWASAGGWLFL